MVDQLTPDRPQVYYQADSTDGWPVTVTLDSKLPIEHLDNPSQHGATCKILAMPLAGFSPVKRSSQPPRIHRETLSTLFSP
jgi:hypothetical protein